MPETLHSSKNLLNGPVNEGMEDKKLSFVFGQGIIDPWILPSFLSTPTDLEKMSLLCVLIEAYRCLNIWLLHALHALLGNVWILLIFLYAASNTVTTYNRHLPGTFVVNVLNLGHLQSAILGYCFLAFFLLISSILMTSIVILKTIFHFL